MSSQSTTASQNQLPIINQTQKIVPAVVIDGINASVSTIEPKNQLPTIAKIPQIELSKINCNF